MSVLYDITFTGTDFTKVDTACTPTVGSALSVYQDVYCNTVRAYYATGAGASLAAIVDTFGTGNFTIRADCYNAGGSTTPVVRIVARRVDDNNMYYVEVSPSTITMMKLVSGTPTTLGTYSRTMASATNETVEFKLNGSALSVLVAGVERIAPVTDTAYSSQGTLWLLWPTNDAGSGHDAGMQVSRWKVDTIAAAATPLRAWMVG
jgi:hypothetical protein